MLATNLTEWQRIALRLDQVFLVTFLVLSLIVLSLLANQIPTSSMLLPVHVDINQTQPLNTTAAAAPAASGGIDRVRGGIRN